METTNILKLSSSVRIEVCGFLQRVEFEIDWIAATEVEIAEIKQFNSIGFPLTIRKKINMKWYCLVVWKRVFQWFRLRKKEGVKWLNILAEQIRNTWIIELPSSICKTFFSLYRVMCVEWKKYKIEHGKIWFGCCWWCCFRFGAMENCIRLNFFVLEQVSLYRILTFRSAWRTGRFTQTGIFRTITQRDAVACIFCA